MFFEMPGEGGQKPVSELMTRDPVTVSPETPTLVSVLVLLALVAVSISVLERRVKGVEVVS